MLFFKKLHIKALSLALLLTLISYDALESRVLPQQYVSEYVMYSDFSERYASFSKTRNTESIVILAFIRLDFKVCTDAYNASQDLGFRLMSFNSDLLKETRQVTAFLAQSIISSESVHPSIV